MRMFMNIPRSAIIFFIFLLTSLSLGDGKQSFVDTLLALGIIGSYIVFFLEKQTARLMPRSILLMWVFVVGYFAARSVFSDSVGYSVSTAIRVIEGFLVYVLFYSLVKSNPGPWFYKSLRFFTVLIVVFALLLMVFPRFAHGLPLMNLLYSTYGHNHSVDVLLLTLPLFIVYAESKNNIFNKALLLLVFGGVVFSFSRLAWTIVFLCAAIWLLVKHKYIQSVVAPLVLLLVFLAAPTAMSRVPINPPNYLLENFNLYKKQLTKPPVWQDPRLKYWKQGASAFRERPWFGSGPGTFYLESRRLEGEPYSYSWFAHSFFLQTLVENGVLGSAPLLFFLVYHGAVFIYFLKRNTDKAIYFKPLFLGLGLTILYSMFEFNLDFLVVWLLFFGILGFLAGTYMPDLKESTRTVQKYFIGICLFVLSVFCLTSAASYLASLLHNPPLAFALAPYSKDRAVDLLSGSPGKNNLLSASALDEIIWFHREDSEVMNQLLVSSAKKMPTNQSLEAFTTATTGDVFNYKTHRLYINYLITNSVYSKIGPAIDFMAKAYLLENKLPYEYKGSGCMVSKRALMTLVDAFKQIKQEQKDYLYIAKTYYFMGLAMLPEDPAVTRACWEMAHNTDGNRGFFYHELASLALYVDQNRSQAKDMVWSCNNNIVGALHCRQILPDLSNLTPPGSLKNYIIKMR